MVRNAWKGTAALLALALFAALPFLPLALADPSGATVTNLSTDFGPSISPQSLSNDGGTISTITLSSVQQNQRWKAYVGNVTGTLTLDDVSNNTIYDWTSISSPSGEVVASRNGSMDFSTVSCATNASVNTEDAFMGAAGTDPSSINRTFNSTDHTATLMSSILLSNCRMVGLYVNDADEGQNSTATFQEFVINGNSGNSLGFVSIINDNSVGFDGNTYDFQMIVPENTTGGPNTYFFWVELS